MKKVNLFALSILALTLSISLASAYNYYHPGYSYEYPDYQSSYQQFPSFQNLPAISDKSARTDNSLTQYSRNVQPQLFDETTRYDEFFKVGRNGRVIITVSAETTIRYLGSAINENYAQQLNKADTRDYILTPQNPTFYDGGAIFESSGAYPSYYYSPRYNQGYYDWHSRSFY